MQIHIEIQISCMYCRKKNINIQIYYSLEEKSADVDTYSCTNCIFRFILQKIINNTLIKHTL